MKKSRVMTIVMDVENEENITILSDNIGGNSAFCEGEINFLQKVLRNREKYSNKLREEYGSSSTF